MNMFVQPREGLVAWVRAQLIGPPRRNAGDPVARDLVGVLPTERFPCGALYPASESGEGLDPAGEELESTPAASDLTGENPASENAAEPAIVRRYVPPSSMGISFFVGGDDICIQVLCNAVGYQCSETRKNDWTRVIFNSTEEDVEIIRCPGKPQRHGIEKLNGAATIDIQWRRFADGWIVTVALCNAQKMAKTSTGAEYLHQRAEKTLFEASLHCVIDAGEVGVYPRVDRSLLDAEEQELELQYGHRNIYAIGHGCAADWHLNPDGTVASLFADPMPSVEVPQMTANTDSGGSAVLSLSALAGIEQPDDALLLELDEFVNDYARWVESQQRDIANRATDDQPAAVRIVERMNTAVLRMRGGLQLLRSDAVARLAFALANRAMLNQMRQHDVVQSNYRDDDVYRWRPFQLAFLLTTLQSTADEDDEFRDTVDLIWFPTGGGKTEAYLGLIAFQIVLRRLRYPDTGGGTAVIMRYTLRLLTRDQFIRASRLICALELIRQQRDDLGVEPVSIGMWVGDATSPNTFDKAAEQIRTAIDADEVPELVIKECPWCGDRFAAKRNYECSGRQFHFHCRNAECDFAATPKRPLPCNIVDEALYKDPPTMLVATVDKFARLAWEQRANAFFGGNKQRPPELIIQDELHLIASALGSVAGLYEAAIDTVVQLRGVHPKYIASTATIRMADQQVKRLYGRDVAVFPPPGINCDDSYFARTVPLEQRPGRLYVGYLAPLLNRQQCLAPLAAALLMAPDELFADAEDKEALLDAWWTQVVYHGSLAGVGNSHTAFASDVRDFMQLLFGTTVTDHRLEKTQGCSKDPEQDSSNESVKEHVKRQATDRTTPAIAQLTSLQSAAQNANIFARLNQHRTEDGCLDAVLATNMVSVGLDVGRLALMVINGQPLTTAEYIQASSRVGRSDTPGIVFTNYYRAQARSLSHYESFRPYHDAFYRFVEPTSVTPFTYQARLRALHAALVIVMRHGDERLLDNSAAGSFDINHSKVKNATDRFTRRCTAAAPNQKDEIIRHIHALLTDWQNEVDNCDTGKRQLSYQASDNDNRQDRLLHNHGDRIHGLWATLQSLRHVENTALLKAL